MTSLEKIEIAYKNLFGFMPGRNRDRIKLSLEIDPEIACRIEELRADLVEPKALDLKTSQLIAFGMVLMNLPSAAENHAIAALRAGATLPELHAVAGLAFLLRGTPGLNLAGEAIAAAIAKTASVGSATKG